MNNDESKPTPDPNNLPAVDSDADPAGVRFGVIGTGRITRRLVADLQSTDGCGVTAIASRTAQRAEWFANQYGIAAPVVGYESLLSRDDVDAVYVSLPPSMHAEWSIAAAESGKHLLCEKPLALTTKEALAIRSACKTHGVRWLDATGWLHHGRTEQMADWIRQSRLGTIGHITAAVSFHRPFVSDDHRLSAELGGGCLLDLGWYTSGMIRWALGKLPARVFADAVMEDGVPIRVSAMFWFECGATASFSCGYDTATRKWFEVAGSDASLICDDFTRPWEDRPTRFWVHEGSGNVLKHDCSDAQERSMIGRLIGRSDLRDYHEQAIETHAILDALAESILSGSPVPVAPVPTDPVPADSASNAPAPDHS